MVKRPLVEKDSDPEYAGAASIEALVLALLDGLNTLEAQDVSPEIRYVSHSHTRASWDSGDSELFECCRRTISFAKLTFDSTFIDFP